MPNITKEQKIDFNALFINAVLEFEKAGRTKDVILSMRERNRISDKLLEDTANLLTESETEDIRFLALRVANIARCNQFGLGLIGNDLKKPIEWWSTKLSEETGEVARAVVRNDKANLKEELADVVIVADLIASKLGVSLGELVRAKFNSSSDKKGSSIRL